MKFRQSFFSSLFLSSLIAGLGFARPSTLFAERGHVCEVRSLGAKGDGKTDDTAGIQAAIDSCASHGGGTIHFPEGTYISSPLALKSHTTLQLDKGATLRGGSDLEKFPIRPDYKWRRTALLHADDQTDIGITGQGVIDGNGPIWWEMAHQHRVPGDSSGSAGYPRPMLLDFVRTTKIRIEGVTIQNSPMYNIALFFCKYVTIKGITIKNPDKGAPNTDGIDPFSTQHVLIANVTIDTGDDCVAIKTGLVERGDPDIPSRDIVIRDSTLIHGHGLSIGSEVAAGVQNVRVERVTFRGTGAGIRVKSNRSRGNDVSGLVYKDLKMEDVATPILLTEYYARIPETDVAAEVSKLTPRFHDITIENLTATGAKSAGTIVGVPESPIHKVKLKNIHISAQTGLLIRNAEVESKDLVIQGIPSAASTAK